MQTFIRLGWITGLIVTVQVIHAAPALAAAPRAGEARPEPLIGWLVAGILLIVWLVAGILLAVVNAALSAVIAAVLAERVRREASLLHTHRSTCFWWGLPTGFLMLLLISIFMQPQGRGPVGWILLALCSLALATGFAGVSLAVGRRLLNDPDRYHPALVTAMGAFVLGLAFNVPVAGWALSFYVACLSLGAFRLTWFGRFVSPPQTSSSKVVTPS